MTAANLKKRTRANRSELLRMAEGRRAGGTHEVALVHISVGYLMWVFVTAHVGMALRHSLSGDHAPLRIFRP